MSGAVKTTEITAAEVDALARQLLLAIGYVGVCSTFLLHAKRHGERLGLDPREILVELGRPGAVAGQEDWIVDVGLQLAGVHNPAPMGH